MIRICIPCGYIYEGEIPFETLPDDWCCPECGAEKTVFSEIDESLSE